MLPREIIRANIEFSCPGRIGFGFTPTADGQARRNDLCNFGVRLIETGESRRWQENGYEYYTDAWGNLWHRLADMSAGGEILTPALDDWEKLDNYSGPRLDDSPQALAELRAKVAAETRRFRIGWMPGWPFATCRYLRRMDNYFMDLIAERERLDILHDRVTTLLEKIIAFYGAAGCDGIMYCEDLGVQDRLLMSPEMWRDIFRPLYERLTSAAHAHGMKVIQHSCGYNWLLIDDLCEAGVDCLQFDQPLVYDIAALAAKLRRHGVGLFSPCDIQKVLPTGDRQLIESKTALLVDTFRGGFIAKNYPDLHGIGVQPEWDRWAYDTFVRAGAPGEAADQEA